MRTLTQLQTSFQNFLLGDKNDINYFISLPKNTSAEERLNIYAQGYYQRLIEVLMEDFPKLLVYAGNKKFAEIARAYIRTHPSDHFAINNIGRNLSEFLLRELPYNQQPVLSELAAFDWTLTRAMDAVDEPILQRTYLQTIPQENWSKIIFRFHSSFHLLTLRWNTMAIWEALRDAQKIPKQKKLTSIKKYHIWRFNLESYYSENTVVEDCVIQAILQRKNFAEICEMLCDHFDENEVAGYVINLILTWIEQGILSSAPVDYDAKKCV